MSFLKFVVCFIALLFACTHSTIEGEQEDEVVILSSADAHAKYRVHVPADPVHQSLVPDSQHRAWATVLEKCTPIDTHGAPSESCLSAMEEYFLAEPVWDNRMYYYRDSIGYESFGSFSHGRLTDRDLVSALPFSAADFRDSFPLWRDIFDGNLKRRQETVLQVVSDSICMGLSSKKSKGVSEKLSTQCAARDLYKYTAYLDACSSATHRLYTLQHERTNLPWTNSKNPPTSYDISLRFIRSEIDDAEARATAIRRMRRGYLLAYWTVQQCKSHGYILIPGLTSGSKTSDRQLLTWKRLIPKHSSKRDDLKLLDLTYQRLMKIAAKSGDEWAIRGFDYRYSRGNEFKADWHQRFPILVHRWIGRHGKTENARRHQAKAYLMLKDQAGEELAQLEYDPSELDEEIQYVLEGGELSYPSSWVKLPTEQTQ